MNSKVTLNVGGKLFTTYRSTIMKYPNTILGGFFSNEDLAKADEKGEYFWDRNGTLFEFILDFYRTGEVIYPTIVSKEVFDKELDFWCIPIPKIHRKLSMDDIVNLSYLHMKIALYIRMEHEIDAVEKHQYKKVIKGMYLALDLLESYVTNARKYFFIHPEKDISLFQSLNDGENTSIDKAYIAAILEVNKSMKVGKIRFEVSIVNLNTCVAKEYYYLHQGKKKYRALYLDI